MSEVQDDVQEYTKTVIEITSALTRLGLIESNFLEKPERLKERLLEANAILEKAKSKIKEWATECGPA
jgi:hypothetical protein